MSTEIFTGDPIREEEAYTVVLMLPDTMASNYGEECAVVVVAARGVFEAEDRAREAAVKRLCSGEEYALDDPYALEETFLPLVTFRGRHEPEIGDNFPNVIRVPTRRD